MGTSLGYKNSVILQNAIESGLYPDECIVDHYAGGGGMSTGIELAGYEVDVAINHDPDAIALHTENHPNAIHYCEDIWMVDPKEVMKRMQERGKTRIGYLHASPDCRHFSIAKGDRPVEKNIRGLSWTVVKWAMETPIRLISLENVKEIRSWGPLIETDSGKWKPDPERLGETWKGFLSILSTGLSAKHPAFKEMYKALNLRFNYNMKEKLRLVKGLGYQVEYKVLEACDFGAATTRPRLFLMARNDGLPIVWPKKTHGNEQGLKPLVPAAQFIDWSLPARSIFGRKKPLADATLKRVFKGLEKEVLNNETPFFVEEEMIVPFITECANSSNERNLSVDRPLPTVTAQPKGGAFALVTAKVEPAPEEVLKASYIIKFRNGGISQSLNEPLHTITSGGNHFGLVSAYLISYYGTGKSHSLEKPLNTITTKDRFALVLVKGNPYRIVDIALRMIAPHELYLCQGFPKGYKFEYRQDGSKRTKQEQVQKVGNSVSPIAGSAIASSLLTRLVEQCELQLAS